LIGSSCELSRVKEVDSAEVNTGTCEQVTAAEKRYICDICYRTFNSARGLGSHKAFHYGVNRHLCKTRNKTFGDSRQLNGHKHVNSSPTSYSSAMCPQTFSNLSTFNQHTAVHTDSRSYRCETSHETFSGTSLREQCSQTHNTNNAGCYTCDVCDKVFSTKILLYIHKCIHSGDQLFICELCRQAFLCHDDLIRHKVDRSYERPCTAGLLLDKVTLVQNDCAEQREDSSDNLLKVSLRSNTTGTDCDVPPRPNYTTALVMETCDRVIGRSCEVEKVEDVDIAEIKYNTGTYDQPTDKPTLTESSCEVETVEDRDIADIKYNTSPCDQVPDKSTMIGSSCELERAQELDMPELSYNTTPLNTEDVAVQEHCSLVSTQLHNDGPRIVSVEGNVERVQDMVKCKYAADIRGQTIEKSNNVETHSAKKQHECHLCCQTFSSVRSLATHGLSHSGVGPYICDVCNKAFGHSSYLAMHKQFHCGRKLNTGRVSKHSSDDRAMPAMQDHRRQDDRTEVSSRVSHKYKIGTDDVTVVTSLMPKTLV